MLAARTYKKYNKCLLCLWQVQELKRAVGFCLAKLSVMSSWQGAIRHLKGIARTMWTMCFTANTKITLEI